MLFMFFFIAINAKRLIMMKRTSLPSLILISVFCPFSLESGGFHFVNEKKKYDDAKRYCRETYTDLATIHNMQEINDLFTLNSTMTKNAWIGLELGSAETWYWTQSDQNTNFFNWKPGEPQLKSEEACAAMDQNSTWFESDCGSLLSFVCHGNGDASSHIFVSEPRTWRDAQSHCWNLSSDLVSIHSAEENRAVRNMSASQNIWIGLFRDPWKWSDGSNSSFRFWGSTKPSYIKKQDCVAVVFSNQGRWDDLNCNNPNSFICYAQTSIPATTSSQTTQTSITTDQPSTSMKTSYQNSSQGFVETLHSTVAATSANTDPTTPTTTIGTTASNTTEFVSHPSSTELNNPRTEMPTPTKLLPKPPVSVTSNSVSALTSQVGTSALSTTQPSSVKSLNLLSDNLILIQKNVTWIEALSYCREYHVDLVHVTSKDIQGKVAQKAQTSTSSFVWLGLRYSCNFKFWFWAGSTSACYQNWALGEGPEGVYECGVSGAIEATGGQQWVGLPETEELNFICSTCAG